MIKLENKNNKLETWILKHYLQLAIFNGVLILLVLLRSAGYFEPYLPITINFIFLVSLILSIFLLGMKSRGAFTLSLLFWLSAAILRIVNVEVWAERSALYSYEAFVAGLLLTFFQGFNVTKKLSAKPRFPFDKN